MNVTTLPELTGTPKQIAWANQIRANFFDMAVKRNIPADLISLFATATDSGWWVNCKPIATSFATAVVSALYGRLITVSQKNELVARYSGQHNY
jgi:hypothetical protein